MSDLTIECPKCQTEIALTETLARPLIQAERAKDDREARERTAAIDKREQEVAQRYKALAEIETSLDAKAADIEEAVTQRLTEERAAIIAVESKKAERQFSVQIDAARRRDQAQTAKIVEMQEAELEYRQKSATLAEEKRQWDLDKARQLEQERETIRFLAVKGEKELNQLNLAAKDKDIIVLNAKLTDAQNAELGFRQQREAFEAKIRAFDLKVARQIDAERQGIREATQREDDERHRLTIAERNAVIDGMAKQVDELRRRIDQGSQQIQGEVLEEDLLSMLEGEFRVDVFDEVLNGRSGGDIIQKVYSCNGAYCGSILWEAKNTKAFNPEWLIKVRKDQRENNAELSVISSVSLPKGNHGFDRIENVWVCSPPHAVALAKALRQGLIDQQMVKVGSEGRGSKADLAYCYILSLEFRQRVIAVLETYLTMKKDLDRERLSTQRQWAKRGKQLEWIAFGIAGIYGDLQGIAGKSMPDVEGLELQQLEVPTPTFEHRLASGEADAIEPYNNVA